MIIDQLPEGTMTEDTVTNVPPLTDSRSEQRTRLASDLRRQLRLGREPASLSQPVLHSDAPLEHCCGLCNTGSALGAAQSHAGRRKNHRHEGGVTHMVLSRMYSGFYLWLTSILITAGGSIWWWRRARSAP
jgi:hypothetical protein